VHNTLSIWREFGPLLDELCGRRIAVSHGEWRQGDQPVYVSDISRAEDALGWSPRTRPAEGIATLHAWVVENRDMIRDVLDDRS
jgi:CDP-paratose 2-epimerase